MDYRKMYDASKLPQLHRFPPAKYVVVDAIVIPGSQGLLDALEILMGLSARVTAGHRGADDYPRGELFPLEGVWEVPRANDATNFEEGITGKIMVRQPDSVEATDFERHKTELARSIRAAQRGHLEAARLVTIDEGLCAQIHHTGPYSSEPASFEVIAKYLRDHDLRRVSETEHREIYLVDARSAQPDDFETILRVQVEAVPGREG